MDSQPPQENAFDPYEILGVPSDATDAIIRSTFSNKLLSLPRDDNGDPDAGISFWVLLHAKNMLLDPVSRFFYDRQAHAGSCKHHNAI